MNSDVIYQVLEHQHIFTPKRYFRQCHASTICRLPDGSFGVAWFGGSHEKAPDVAIWFSKKTNEGWSEPVKVADDKDIPCWNPVLFAQENQVLLFYKVGQEISRWQTMIKISLDSGETWSEAKELVKGDFGGRGPVKNKCILLADGSILAPASTEGDGWKCFTDHSVDQGKTWTRSEDVVPQSGSVKNSGMIQPTLWQDASKQLHMLMRSSEGCIFRSGWDKEIGKWGEAYPTALPNNNCGIDLARLSDGRLVLVYNPVSGNWAARTPIAFSVSADNGTTWSEPQILDYVPCETNQEYAEFSYPAIIAEDSDVYLTYTWKRRTIAFWHIRIL